MAGPLANAGAMANPTRYAALNMAGEQFTGIWTQRSPYRDAATQYLIKKFYQGSRFDSILDGLNREIGARLSDVRRPGFTVYNVNTFPPANSFYSWKYIQGGAEVVRVLEDGTDGVIYDATAGQKSTLMTKAAGAGRARFLGVGRELFIGDGVEQMKILTGSQAWAAAATIAPGTLIEDGNGKMQMALGGITMTIVATASNGVNEVTVWVDPQNVPAQFANLQAALVTFSGLTVGTFLNGNTYAVNIVSSTLGILTISLVEAAYNETADTGAGTTGTGITGGTVPAFSAVQYAITADGGQQWKCYGPATENWGVATPLNAPVLTQVNGTRFWQANTAVAPYYSVMDSNGYIQIVIYPGKTGRTYPQFSLFTVPAPALGWAQTNDGTAIWGNFGKPGTWTAATAYGFPLVAGEAAVILDSNRNLQATFGSGTSGGTVPVWSTALYGNTTDGGITWTCLGPGIMLTTASVQYAYALHGIDGSVSTASPATLIQGPILGASFTVENNPLPYFTFQGTWPFDSQLDQVWIYRTAQGQSLLLFEDAVPIDNFRTGGQFYGELGITDTSTNGSGALSIFTQAAVAHQNDPPPAGLTGMVRHLQRIWGFAGNKLYYSNGPDAVVSTSNGSTGWAPLKDIEYPAALVKLLPITVQNGGLLVFTTSGIYIVLGTGTASNPFYSTIYCEKLNLANYDALDVIGTEIYMMEANGKVGSVLVEYPFNPQSGYTEVGFPIGDQFKMVTTGGYNAALFAPASCYVSWNVQASGETAMYVASGGGAWFRLSQVSPPETGILWSPLGVMLNGGSAMQSVETSPGVYDLLMGPAAPGPIFKRDTTGTVWTDPTSAGHGTFVSVPYPSWDAKGVNLLCSTGQWTEVAHISAKSKAVGARPVVSVLMGEIAPTVERPWNVLEVTSPDPASTPRSKSVYSDRYDLAQNGIADAGDCILTKFDYGLQAVGDELLDWGIYATTEDERKEEAAK
ncbi:MAG: hypothetical protein WBQ94_04310 [Terracidiphilus sp.]